MTLVNTDDNFRLQENMQEVETVMFDSITIPQPSIQWFHHHLESTPSTANLLAHIQAGIAVYVSDESFFPDDIEGFTLTGQN